MSEVTLENILDGEYVSRQNRDIPLKVELKRSPVKGFGIYATQPIKDEEVIALYHVKVFRNKGYESPTNRAYVIGVYTPSGNESRVWTADIVPESLKPPILSDDEGYFIPYWAYFSNEPSPGQTKNAYIDMNEDEIYAERKRIKEGDMITYKLIAIDDINPGEEIVWDYGKEYGERDYEV